MGLSYLLEFATIKRDIKEHLKNVININFFSSKIDTVIINRIISLKPDVILVFTDVDFHRLFQIFYV